MKHTIESDILEIDKAALTKELESKTIKVLEIHRPRTHTEIDAKGEAAPVQLKAKVVLEIDGEKKLTKKKQEELQDIVDSHSPEKKAKTIADLEATLKLVQEQIKLLKAAK